MTEEVSNPFKGMRRPWLKIRDTLPVDVSYFAAAYFKAMFRVQGWSDGKIEPWEPRKVRSARESAKNEGRAILIQSGNLRNSVRPTPGFDYAGVTAGSNKVPYAAIHNEGGQAGRGLKATIPQRQYMGDNEAMMNHLERVLFDELEMLWQHPERVKGHISSLRRNPNL